MVKQTHDVTHALPYTGVHVHVHVVCKDMIIVMSHLSACVHVLAASNRSTCSYTCTIGECTLALVAMAIKGYLYILEELANHCSAIYMYTIHTCSMVIVGAL